MSQKPSPSTIEDELTFSRFDRMSERYPDKTAVIYLGQRFSYLQLQELSMRFAGALADLDVKKGDRVMIYIPNCIHWVIAFLAIQKIGAVIVPVSPIYTSHELEYMINDSGADTIICQDTNFCYAKEVFADSCLKRIIVTNSEAPPPENPGRPGPLQRSRIYFIYRRNHRISERCSRQSRGYGVVR